jgi:hypothetical protein
MITVVVIGAVAAAAMFVILLKLSPNESKVEKMEKGDILKQLLALSELEAPTAKAKATLPQARPQSANAHPPKSGEIKPAEKTSECLGC